MDPRLGIINISRANRVHIGGVALFAEDCFVVAHSCGELLNISTHNPSISEFPGFPQNTGVRPKIVMESGEPQHNSQKEDNYTATLAQM